MNKKILLKFSIIIAIVIVIITVTIIFIKTYNGKNKTDLYGAKMLLSYNRGTTWYDIYLYDDYAICSSTTGGINGPMDGRKDTYSYKNNIDKLINKVKAKSKDNIIYTGRTIDILFVEGNKQYKYALPETDVYVNEIINNILNYKSHVRNYN